MLVLPVAVIPNDFGVLSPGRHASPGVSSTADRRHVASQRDGAV